MVSLLRRTVSPADSASACPERNAGWTAAPRSGASHRPVDLGRRTSIRVQRLVGASRQADVYHRGVAGAAKARVPLDHLYLPSSRYTPGLAGIRLEGAIEHSGRAAATPD